MKKIKFLAVLVLFSLFSTLGFSQPQPDGGPGGPTGDTGNGSGNELGGNGPIGSGLFILLGLGAAYGGKKLYNMKKEDLDS